jgi:hypothetical protein
MFFYIIVTVEALDGACVAWVGADRVKALHDAILSKWMYEAGRVFCLANSLAVRSV